jgi:hypothetical protein
MRNLALGGLLAAAGLLSGIRSAAAQPNAGEPPPPADLAEVAPTPPPADAPPAPTGETPDPPPPAGDQPPPPPIEPAPELPASPTAPMTLAVTIPPNDNGKHLVVGWDLAPEEGPQGSKVGFTVLVFRRVGSGPEKLPIEAMPLKLAVGKSIGKDRDTWTLVAAVAGDPTFVDEMEPGRRYSYAVVHAVEADTKDTYVAVSPPVFSKPIAPVPAFFHTDRWFFLLVIVVIAAALFAYMRLAKSRPKDVFIRRIPGVDAIEEAVGRSTEMGRPVLYVTGTDEIQNIQTIASLLILGHVAELTAQYDTEIKVANCYPLTMVVAEEIVRQGYANAGRIDAHKPENVMFFSSEQFAYAASINGLVLRDRPATNIFLGRFFGESLILAETGFITGAVQIGGTAEITQLPFFIAACDYAVIGEELYAVSAYLTREPTLLATLKATDLVKVLIILLIVAGVVMATGSFYQLGPVLVP